MATKFEIREYLSSRREEVIAKYNKLTQEQFFNGISLKNFMVQVMNIMAANCKSQKTADSKFEMLMGQIYFDNSRINSRSAKDDALRRKYAGTAFMAMV